ncbi:MAG: MFS transporter [Rhodobacteraceae bacterium]|nr:MFS transporter [Paracoccaceae bacterium]
MTDRPAAPPLDFAEETLIDAEAATVPPPPPHQPAPGLPRLAFAATIVLIGFNLRPLYSSLGTLLPEVMAGTGLGPAGASMLTTLPVLCLGIFGPMAPHLARRFGTERAVLGLLLVLALGTGLRAIAEIPALAAGTLLAGLGIANLNVLLPGLIKRDFAAEAGVMSGFYVMALCGGAALAAGFTVPLARALGGSWSAALGLWAVPCLVAALLWAPQMQRGETAQARLGALRVRGLWQSRLAWQLTAFMALQSMFSFSVFGWLSPILQARGLDAAEAGTILSVSVLCQMAACLLAPPFAARRADQRHVNVVVTLTACAGFLGCIFAPVSTVWGWAILQGFGQGALTSVALTLIVLRSEDSRVAAELSSMVQSVGYGLGASGPLLVGLLHAWTGGFAAVGVYFCVVAGLCCLAGLGAGRALYVPVRLESAS